MVRSFQFQVCLEFSSTDFHMPSFIYFKFWFAEKHLILHPFFLLLRLYFLEQFKVHSEIEGKTQKFPVYP